MSNSETCLRLILNMIPQQMHIKIHYCFRVTVSPNWKQGLRNNINQHILFVKSGSGKYIFEDGEEILEKGKVIYVSSYCPHDTWHDVKNPLVITGLRFGFYDNITNKVLKLPCDPFHISFSTDDIEFYDKLCSNINNSYYFVDNYSSQLLCSSLITYLLSDILYHYEPYSKVSIQSDCIEAVQREIMKDLKASITIEKLAAYIQMSSRQLQTRFKKKYGVTPKQYQLRVRMNYAKFLLETSDLSIGKIALRIGYSDQFVFTKQFKNFFGITPTEFRKMDNCHDQYYHFNPLYYDKT